ncbi:uncharacterized protein DSM5745_00745 [Aspergillus mulundensis]|uniref:Uncharacterized protein n=1 Tax=Aspergillus mulundensis TaxID=1810919 RepID=A0A3D8T4E5_9EURO|nr:hypothetical protein DSM5745_00745 [Aspergillus mulundensis]RDW93423.1 hypothetical protein DSM5745_00745 [Aspergillus mulundensis]
MKTKAAAKSESRPVATQDSDSSDGGREGSNQESSEYDDQIDGASGGKIKSDDEKDDTYEESSESDDDSDIPFEEPRTRKIAAERCKDSDTITAAKTQCSTCSGLHARWHDRRSYQPSKRRVYTNSNIGEPSSTDGDRDASSS